ncbi:hypothetical protein Clacol_002701 [Clathrus columnatus]|uniref:Uncharacterized protein n=1 Tax=Clathrus columnatus TaxID=1419009 RepID=A0AAV5A5K1_9AGAM|nr:hypothetical protein Clacol_002701 [Clathrus columnatus]
MSFYRKILQRYPDSYTAQILALDTHCSNLNSRLISALDSIDAIRLSHKQELDDLQHRMHILDARFQMMKNRVKLAEMERDELREGVERLVEKGGTTTTIALLEAQIARRDIELESCRPYSHVLGSQPNEAAGAAGLFGTIGSNDVAQYPLTKMVETCLNPESLRTFPYEEGLKVLEETAGRQRMLQTEVASLCEKLDNEKKLVSEVITSSNLDQPEVTKMPNRIPSAVSGSRISSTVETIEQHVHQLNIDMKDMQAERDNVADFNPSTTNGDEQLKRCLLLEEECIRRRKSEQELRQKLLLASTAEEDLKNLVKRLQEQLHDHNSPPNVDNTPSVNDTSFITPTLVRVNQIQTELEQTRSEVDRRQVVIDELRNQIALLHQQNQNIEENG